jgi:hypothetical protein
MTTRELRQTMRTIEEAEWNCSGGDWAQSIRQADFEIQKYSTLLQLAATQRSRGFSGKVEEWTEQLRRAEARKCACYEEQRDELLRKLAGSQKRPVLKTSKKHQPQNN